MITLKASKARIPPKVFNLVAYKGERVCIRRHKEEEVFVISREDMELLEALEDRYWGETARSAIKEMKAKGQKPIPWKTVKAKLGL
jgi:PHD/YefM family antitoxin component YafN of YafNO toxin-antitoxin module